MPVCGIFALFPKNVVEATSNYLLNYWIPVALYVNMIGLPALMLIVGKIRLRKQQA
jgi:spore germination protein KB